MTRETVLTREVENLPPAHWGRCVWDNSYWTWRDLVVPDQFYDNLPYAGFQGC